MSSPETSAAPAQQASPRQQFLDAYVREHATTLRVLRAMPEEKAELKPSEKSKSARELAWLFVMEQDLGERALTTGFDWSAPPPAPPPVPETLAAIIDAFDQGHRRVAERVRTMPEAQLRETVKFFVAPKTIGDVPRMEFLWFLLHDQIHHRGQFSVYLRIAGARVPSIYGPTADEPWF